MILNLSLRLVSFSKNQNFLFDTKLYCLAGYWIEELNPGTFQSIFYEKSKQRINQYKEIKKDVDEFMKDINLEYKSIKKEIKSLF